MIRRPPRSTLDRSSAASDVYKRQAKPADAVPDRGHPAPGGDLLFPGSVGQLRRLRALPVSYTHLRAHETVLDLVCRLLLEKKNNRKKKKFI